MAALVLAWPRFNSLLFDFLFQVNRVPISRKISQSIKSVMGTKKDGNSPAANGKAIKNRRFEDDDIEMADQASKADKSVLDDAAIEDFLGTSKKETAADYIDKASRVLFPFLFIAFNVVYWVYFTITG